MASPNILFMSDKEYAPIQCKNFKDEGCSVWCMEGDLDCCVLCCKRRKCAKEGKICPIAEVILKKEEFRNKKYSWED